MANIARRFRGGRAKHRDSWYGLERKKDFRAFRKYWHREGKKGHNGNDLSSREEAEQVYRDWKDSGSREIYK